MEDSAQEVVGPRVERRPVHGFAIKPSRVSGRSAGEINLIRGGNLLVINKGVGGRPEAYACSA